MWILPWLLLWFVVVVVGLPVDTDSRGFLRAPLRGVVVVVGWVDVVDYDPHGILRSAAVPLG